MLFFFFLSAFARLQPHPFRAESQHLCNICTESISEIQLLDHKELDRVNEIVLGKCLKTDGMDCSAPCQMFLDEIESGEIGNVFEGSAEDICLEANWCKHEKYDAHLKTLPSQKPELVNYINRVQSSWKAGIYKGSANKTRHEFRRLLGAIVDPELRCKLTKDPSLTGNFKAPTDFDSAVNWPECAKVINDIRDQSNCGCCWAFAAAEAASDRLCIATNGTTLLPLSAQDMCFCAKMAGNGCNGGQIASPWYYIMSSGLVTGGQVDGSGPFGSGLCSDFSMPHCHHHGPQGNDPYPAEGDPGCPSQHSAACPRRCDSTATSPHDVFSEDKYTMSSVTGLSARGEKEIMEKIQRSGPVETAFTVYEDFANYVSGIYTHVSGSVEGGHAVKIVGWGEENGIKYWKVANSWNPYWGEDGFFRIVRGRNECGIENQVTGGEGMKKM